jgi:hypothetical protein
MDNIPKQFKDLAESAELYDQSEKVGNKFGLMIDQIGELDAEIRGVLLGLFKPTDFPQHLVERLEIKLDVAQQITEEVNKEIFQVIKAKLQAETPVDNSNADLEKIGDFTIEEESAPLHQPVVETHTEPLVDHLLSRPTYVPQEKVQAAPVVPVTPVAPVKPVEPVKKPSGPDLYREPIE